MKNVIISKQPEYSDNLNSFLKIINEKKINIMIAGTGQDQKEKKELIKIDLNNKIFIENNVFFEILWPLHNNMISEKALNNNSIVAKLHYKNFSCTFTGDIEEIAEKQILQEYKDNLEILNSTVLKVAHHGSKTSSSKEFIKTVKPKIALIGVEENNKFGHPNEEVIERLEKIRHKNLPH